MPWVTQSIGKTTFGSVVRHEGKKYIFLDNNKLIALKYYVFNITTIKEIDLPDYNGVWEVWKDEELFSKLHIPNHEKEDSCALGILDNLSGD